MKDKQKTNPADSGNQGYQFSFSREPVAKLSISDDFLEECDKWKRYSGNHTECHMVFTIKVIDKAIVVSSVIISGVEELPHGDDYFDDTTIVLMEALMDCLHSSAIDWRKLYDGEELALALVIEPESIGVAYIQFLIDGVRLIREPIAFDAIACANVIKEA